MEDLVGNWDYPLVSTFLHSKSFGCAKFVPQGAPQIASPAQNLLGDEPRNF